MTETAATIGKYLIAMGLVFDLLGCIGLVRFPDVYNRLQASTKCVTFGTCSIMFGAFLMLGFSAAGIKALLLIVFLVLTAPVSAHALSRGAYVAGVKLCDKSVVDKYGEERAQKEQQKGSPE